MNPYKGWQTKNNKGYKLVRGVTIALDILGWRLTVGCVMSQNFSFGSIKKIKKLSIKIKVQSKALQNQNFWNGSHAIPL